MTDITLVESLREALLATMLAGAPVLVVAFVTGTVCGLLQAATGIHEAVVGLLPRWLAVGLALVATLPWMLERMVDLVRASVTPP